MRSMCGFVGFLQCSGSLDRGDLEATIADMTSKLVHRGPDDGSTWVEVKSGLAIGHRRLAIVDLSSRGRQPMVSEGGRYVIVFNGEIYNYRALRSELQSASGRADWRSNTDTEVILAGFLEWGVEETLRRCVGMFALALWDRRKGVLTLARDRFGEKPLYYGWAGQGKQRGFVFGSELKAFRPYPSFNPQVCREALAEYLTFGYVPAPKTIFCDLYKLEPGCLLTVNSSPPFNPPNRPMRPGLSSSSVSIQNWWSFRKLVEDTSSVTLKNESEALRCLETEITQAIKLQAVADVPLGAFLSGGVDSSIVVALMQKQLGTPVQTFTIGFDEKEFDESSYARSVAEHLGTNHHELRVSSQMARTVIPNLCGMYDEPFADASAIPTFLVCQAARRQVTVALSGDGGDELFGGYERYFWVKDIWSKVNWLPQPIRQGIGQLMMTLPVSMWDAMARPFDLARNADGFSRAGDKLHRLGLRMKTVQDIDDLYENLVSQWTNVNLLIRGFDNEARPNSRLRAFDTLVGKISDKSQLHMMYRDTTSYLPDDVLCKVDRAAMASGLETRVPFLDHRVVECAWRLPIHMKLGKDGGKWALRQILYKYVPRELIDRPKAGFALPIARWLRGPLRDWAEELLSERRLVSEGNFNPEPIRKAWSAHLKNHCDNHGGLWTVLMFQQWLSENSNQRLMS